MSTRPTANIPLRAPSTRPWTRMPLGTTACMKPSLWPSIPLPSTATAAKPARNARTPVRLLRPKRLPSSDGRRLQLAKRLFRGPGFDSCLGRSGGGRRRIPGERDRGRRVAGAGEGVRDMMPLTVRPPAGGDPVKGRSVRTFAVLCTAALVVAACSKPAKKVAKSATQATLAPVASSTSTSAAPTPAAAAAAAAAKGAAKAVVGTTTHSSLPFGAPVNESYARALGDKIFPQSTQRVRPYYSGVGEDSIQLDFSYDATSCGVNVVNAITAAGGALPTTSRYYRAAPSTQSQVIADTKEGVAQMVQFWNDHAFDVAGHLPHTRPLLGHDAHHQFFGR